jgi:hypothetical protein
MLENMKSGEWIFPKHNTLYSGHKVHFFTTVLLQCPVANRIHDLQYFYSVQASFSLSHLG